MSQKIFFTPGPTQMYPGMDEFLKDALEEDVCSISHRSNAFKAIYKHTCDSLRKLIDLPSDYHIFFLGSATESWERIFNSLVESKSFHFVNGSFSKKFHQYGIAAGMDSQKIEAPFGEGFDTTQVNIDPSTDLIAFTNNETSSGVQTPFSSIYPFRESNPDALIAVDVVSSIPYPEINFNKIDTALFSVQKCFGMPAGLGVWLVNERCLERAEQKKSDNRFIGIHHTTQELLKRELGNQTPSTPNVLGIYLLGCVCDDMLERGADTIRKETELKAELLYSFLEASENFDIAVKNEEHRSQTVVVANTKVAPATINGYLANFNMQIGVGYGDYKNTQVRIANFPAISVSDVERLIDLLSEESSYC